MIVMTCSRVRSTQTGLVTSALQRDSKHLVVVVVVVGRGALA